MVRSEGRRATSLDFARDERLWGLEWRFCPDCHPERVSGSICIKVHHSRRDAKGAEAGSFLLLSALCANQSRSEAWMLKHVQHDEEWGGLGWPLPKPFVPSEVEGPSTPRLRVNRTYPATPACAGATRLRTFTSARSFRCPTDRPLCQHRARHESSRAPSPLSGPLKAPLFAICEQAAPHPEGVTLQLTGMRIRCAGGSISSSLTTSAGVSPGLICP